jgi:hypothetical protein
LQFSAALHNISVRGVVLVLNCESDDLVWCLGRERAAGAGRMRMGRGGEIDLPLEGEVPAEFSLKKNYPGKKWSSDSAHIKYRLDNNKDLDTIEGDVLKRMFEFNKPYLQACPIFHLKKAIDFYCPKKFKTLCHQVMHTCIS